MRSISTDRAQMRVDAGNDGPISADAIFLATGKHDVRGMKRQATGTIDDLIGFKMHYRLASSQRQAIEAPSKSLSSPAVMPGSRWSSRMLPISASLYRDVPSSRSAKAGTAFSITSSTSARIWRIACKARSHSSNVRCPSSKFPGFLHAPDPNDPQGLFRLGDQAGVIPSFTGEGMSIALHSGCLAAATYFAHGRASSLFHHRIRSEIHRSIRLAFILNHTLRHAAGQRSALSPLSDPGLLPCDMSRS